ncbi:MAG: rhodanese-like domain-containing protein [Chlamydiae bacterium]|jgi:rhodanese-related sulfurtransferase|nr:rhodanese-like domain-containing protein [Chlamydiota bacterium]
MQSIDAKHYLELKKQFPKTVLIDVREQHEVDEKRIKESIHIPMKEIENHLFAIQDKDHIVIACRSGGRAKEVARYLSSLGYKNVYYLITFIEDWEKEGLHVEKGVRKKFSLENYVLFYLSLFILIPSILGLHHPNWLYVPILISSLLMINALLKRSLFQYFKGKP